MYAIFVLFIWKPFYDEHICYLFMSISEDNGSAVIAI